MNAITDRDRGQCVCCGLPLLGQQVSVHHRILGRRSDNRPSNLITLWGSGTTHHHALVHSHPAIARISYGYIVSRHGTQLDTLAAPIWYSQPALYRVGWYLLNDDGGLSGPLDMPAPVLGFAEMVSHG